MKKIIVQTEEPVRLDRFLRRQFKSATQGVIEKALRSGKIKLNNKKVKASERVNQSDEIAIAPDVFEVGAPKDSKHFSKNTIILSKKLFSEYLLYDCDEFLAIDKPAGLAVQGGSKINLSIDEALAYMNQVKGGEYKIVHRLDKATSGILLIAKGFASASKIGDAFLNKEIKKTYTAILSGMPEDPEGTLVHEIGKDRSGVFEVVKELKVGGKRAETRYKVLKANRHNCLVEFYPQTGRMHQLRFHSKALGCPIVGDEKYGGLRSKRMMLHASLIEIPEEVFGKKIVIKSELPEGF